MLAHPTLDQLSRLGLHGMAKAFTDAEASPEAASLSHAEWLAILLDREATLRVDKRLSARLRHARLRQQATPEDIDYRAARGLDRKVFQSLLTGEWIKAHEGVLICGPTGVGKSFLACALAHKACRDNYSVVYQRAPLEHFSPGGICTHWKAPPFTAHPQCRRNPDGGHPAESIHFSHSTMMLRCGGSSPRKRRS